MTPETPKSQRARLFVALDLPDELQAELGSWGAAELTDPALRPVAPENLHITLAFLGHRPVGEVERIAAALEHSATAAPRVELLDPVTRPERGRSRLYALPARSPGAERIQARVSDLLASARLYEPEKQKFWPHLTVARVRVEGRGSRRPKLVRRVPGGLPAAARKPCFCRRLTLYRSELQPSGARYVPLAQVKLSVEGSSEVI